MWTVGLSLSGNEVGYSLEEYASAPAAEVSDRIAVADAKLRAAGAHYVVQSVRDLPAVLLDIAARMRAGERA
ncbi:Phosphonoacetaldehyde hydrolase [compost metagenome]